MGYRSEVAYAVRFKDKEHRIRFMAVQALNPHLDLTEFKLLKDDTIIFHDTERKWYDDYDDVKAHKQLLWDAEDQACEWEFSRVGEDHDDIVYECGEEGRSIDLIEVYTSMHITDMEGTVDYPVGEQL